MVRKEEKEVRREEAARCTAAAVFDIEEPAVLGMEASVFDIEAPRKASEIAAAVSGTEAPETEAPEAVLETEVPAAAFDIEEQAE